MCSAPFLKKEWYEMKKEQRFEVTPTKADGGVSFDVVTDKQTIRVGLQLHWQ